MNVYVRELSRAMGELGIRVDIFTREHEDGTGIEEIIPGIRVIHLPGGPHDAGVGELYAHLPGFLDEVRNFQEEEGCAYEVVHSTTGCRPGSASDFLRPSTFLMW